MIKTTVSNCSNTVTQILFEGAEDVLGADKLRDLLAGQRQDDILFSWANAGPLLRQMEKTYGVAGARGLAQRIGRAAFKYGVKRFGEQAGIHTPEFRLLPAPRRIATGLAILAQVLGDECNDTISVMDSGPYWLWRSERCPVCQDHTSPDPNCYLVVGLLQEFTTWAGGGRFYPVTETACRSNGAPACEYRIDKKPLD